MPDKLFADALCRGLIEICSGIVKIIRAYEKKYELIEHKIPAMEKTGDLANQTIS